MRRIVSLIVLMSMATAPMACAPRPTPRQQRTSAILQALKADDQRIAQLNMQNRSLEIALHFLATHAGADLQVDWAGLEREGISRKGATTTINFFNATLDESLRAVLWQQRPRHGSVGYQVRDGVLVIGLEDSVALAAETDDQKKGDAAILRKLAEPLDLGERRGVADSAENLIYVLGFSKKISVVVDWTGLERAGVKRDTMLVPKLESPTTQRELFEIFAALKPANDGIAYNIRGGILWVSTQARTEAEKTDRTP